jgi:hypothetical protein
MIIPYLVKRCHSTMIALLSTPRPATFKAALVARAKALGHETTPESDVHVVADGRRIEAASLTATRLAFMLRKFHAQCGRRLFLPFQQVVEVIVNRIHLGERERGRPTLAPTEQRYDSFEPLTCTGCSERALQRIEDPRN